MAWDLLHKGYSVVMFEPGTPLGGLLLDFPEDQLPQAVIESEVEKLANVYDSLLAIVRDHEGDMQPFERCNARKALGALWQIANGMDLDPDQLYDIGV